MTKCQHADAYLAIFPPRCGCETCLLTWQAAQHERIRRANAGRTWRCSVCRRKGETNTVGCTNRSCPAVVNPMRHERDLAIFRKDAA